MVRDETYIHKYVCDDCGAIITVECNYYPMPQTRCPVVACRGIAPLNVDGTINRG